MENVNIVICVEWLDVSGDWPIVVRRSMHMNEWCFEQFVAKYKLDEPEKCRTKVCIPDLGHIYRTRLRDETMAILEGFDGYGMWLESWEMPRSSGGQVSLPNWRPTIAK